MKRKLVYGAEYGTPDSVRRKPGRSRYPAVKVTEEQIIEAFNTWFYDYALDMASDKFGYSFNGCTVDKFEVGGLSKPNPNLYLTLACSVNVSNSEANMYIKDRLDIFSVATGYRTYMDISGVIKQYSGTDQVLKYFIENGAELIDVIFYKNLSINELDRIADKFNARIDEILDLPNTSEYGDIIENIEVELYTEESGRRIYDVTWEDVCKDIKLRCVYTTLKPISDTVPEDFYAASDERDDNFIIDDHTAGFSIWIPSGINPYKVVVKQLNNNFRYLFMDDSDDEMAEKIFNIILSNYVSHEELIQALRGYDYTVYPDSKGNVIFEILRDAEHTYGGKPIKFNICNIDEYRERGLEAIKIWHLIPRINKAFNYRRRNYGDME